MAKPACHTVAVCAVSHSDSIYQNSYLNLTDFLGKIRPNSDSKSWLIRNNKKQRVNDVTTFKKRVEG